MGSDSGECWRKILTLSWFGHQSRLDRRRRPASGGAPCATGHWPALPASFPSMDTSDCDQVDGIGPRTITTTVPEDDPLSRPARRPGRREVKYPFCRALTSSAIALVRSLADRICRKPSAARTIIARDHRQSGSTFVWLVTGEPFGFAQGILRPLRCSEGQNFPAESMRRFSTAQGSADSGSEFSLTHPDGRSLLSGAIKRE